MPNMPYFGFQSAYQNQNNITLQAFLEIQKKLDNIEQKLNDLESRVKALENQKNKTFEYQTSMNMM